MTKRFMLDSSFAMTWCFEDEATEFTKLVLRSLNQESGPIIAFVPYVLWELETWNALFVAERRGRLTSDDVESFRALAAGLIASKAVRPLVAPLAESFALAKKHQLSSYDALYLSLAKEEALPLASFDKALCQAAAKESISVVDEAWVRQEET